MARLTARDVKHARILFAEGKRLRALAADLSLDRLALKFEVSKSAMFDALSYRTWTHIVDSGETL
jgi:hypothetical protein